MNHLRTEFHCHNIYSNDHLGDLEPPFDCDVSIYAQLEQSLKADLDVLFVTNHNTLNGCGATVTAPCEFAASNISSNV